MLRTSPPFIPPSLGVSVSQDYLSPGAMGNKGLAFSEGGSTRGMVAYCRVCTLCGVTNYDKCEWHATGYGSPIGHFFRR